MAANGIRKNQRDQDARIREAEALLKLSGLTAKQVELLELYRKGLSVTEIAEKLHVTRQCAYDYLCRMRHRATWLSDDRAERISRERMMARRYRTFCEKHPSISYERFCSVYNIALGLDKSAFVITKRVFLIYGNEDIPDVRKAVEGVYAELLRRRLEMRRKRNAAS